MKKMAGKEHIATEKRKYRKSLATKLFVLLFLLTGIFPFAGVNVQAKDPGLVVCIDPGHGGENKGAQYRGRDEKDQDLKIALAMYEELSKYEGVKVVMTRTTDIELSLPERAQIAEDVGADFLYCIHLNASAGHDQFGAEVWTSGFGEYYAKGATFGRIELEELQEQCGIYTGRGVKTKINDEGEKDYYGIIQSSRIREIPAVIIEHCYMDNFNDSSNWMTDEALTKLGIADATAVAKYYGLKSGELGVDYSNYACFAYPVPSNPVYQDNTSPELVSVSLTQYDSLHRIACLHITAEDEQSGVCYYSYSTDGGRTWSKLYEWKGQASVNIMVPIISNLSRNICVRVWNPYCEYAVSRQINLQR